MQRILFMLLLFGVLMNVIKSNPIDQEKEENINEKDDESEKVPVNVKEGSKYFQDIYNAQNTPFELEFGHVRETPDDWEQRFEKADFKKNSRQGKVRWGDKNGAYGEQYWDLNHGQPEKQEEEESQQHGQRYPLTKTSNSNSRLQRQTNDAEFINDEARLLYKSGKMQKHGGNYRKEDDEDHYPRAKREGNDYPYIFVFRDY